MRNPFRMSQSGYDQDLSTNGSNLPKYTVGNRQTGHCCGDFELVKKNRDLSSQNSVKTGENCSETLLECVFLDVIKT